MYRKKKYENDEALKRLRKYCAYQDRCQKEVREKLYNWGFGYADAGELIVRLIEEQFLDEERFARAYARGKFNNNSWGRRKIIQGLRRKGITEQLRDIALEEIDESDYRQKLREILEKKWSTMRSPGSLDFKQRLAHYAIQKGFEFSLVWELINEKY